MNLLPDAPRGFFIAYRGARDDWSSRVNHLNYLTYRSEITSKRADFNSVGGGYVVSLSYMMRHLASPPRVLGAQCSRIQVVEPLNARDTRRLVGTPEPQQDNYNNDNDNPISMKEDEPLYQLTRHCCSHSAAS